MKRPVFGPRTRFTVGISGGKDGEAALLWALNESGIAKNQIEATFCDTGNEHEHTYAQIRYINENIHPVITLFPEMDFFELAKSRKRFPSAKARFCTEMLKIIPTLEHVMELRYRGFEPISIAGTRAEESEDRKNLPEWDYSGNLLCIQWRPLIRWTFADVVAIHERYGLPFNPLYALGAKRVGCFPCIMSNKAEVRMIAQQFPERIAKIREAEQDFENSFGRYSSFFASNTIPERFRSKPFTCEDGREMNVATIDDVARWSFTGKRAQGQWDDEPTKEPVSCNSGFCE